MLFFFLLLLPSPILCYKTQMIAQKGRLIDISTKFGMERFHVRVVRHCFELFAALRADFCFLLVYVGLVIETGEVVA